MKKETIIELKKKKDKEVAEECMICLQEFEPTHIVVILPCVS